MFPESIEVGWTCLSDIWTIAAKLLSRHSVHAGDWAFAMAIDELSDGNMADASTWSLIFGAIRELEKAAISEVNGLEPSARNLISAVQRKH